MKKLDIRSLKGLGWKLGRRPSDLQDMSSKIGSYYRTKHERKKDGSFRRIDAPQSGLKRVQKKIYEALLSSLEWPEYLHGGIQSRSPDSMAANHLGKIVVVRIDIKDFYASVSKDCVYWIWNVLLGCSPDVASLLTKLTTYRHSLPQGAPTSGSLANLSLYDADLHIDTAARQRSLRYDRFVDDLIFSGEHDRGIIGPVISILRDAGFRVKRSKVEMMYGNRRQEILGLIVNKASHPSLPSEYRDGVRAQIHGNKNPSAAREEQRASIKGKLQRIRRYNPGDYRRSMQLFSPHSS